MNGERRQFPRVRSSLPARVHFEAGAASPAMLLNISRSGVQIECGIDAARRMTASARPPQPLRPVLVVLLTELPFEDGSRGRLEAKARIVIPRRVSSTLYRIGARFTDMEPESVRDLERFLLEHLGPERGPRTHQREDNL